MRSTATLIYTSASDLADGDLRLRTAQSPGTPTRFFQGFVERAEQTARALLAVANVAASSYYVQFDPSSIDPVVTADGTGLRFESFSSCCGVYAKLDLLGEGLDGAQLGTGTTNVDINPPLRRALTTVSGLDPLHLDVGADDLTVTTMQGRHVERKVPLPERWVRGFAEAAVLGRDLTLLGELTPTAAARFLRELPRRGGDAVLWAQPAGGSLRLSSRPGPGAACLSGTGRLVELLPVLRSASALRYYGPEQPAQHGLAVAPVPSAWEVVLPGGRLTLMLSPQASRGFSGEGAGLLDLAGESRIRDRVLDELAGDPRTAESIAAALREPLTEVRRSLSQLGVDGRIGYDLADRRYFHRELPFRPQYGERANPRLAGARRILERGAVEWLDSDTALVRGGSSVQQVRRAGQSWACSCRWFARYRGSRGPCKHVLAVTIQVEPSGDRSTPTSRGWTREGAETR